MERFPAGAGFFGVAVATFGRMTSTPKKDEDTDDFITPDDGGGDAQAPVDEGGDDV